MNPKSVGDCLNLNHWRAGKTNRKIEKALHSYRIETMQIIADFLDRVIAMSEVTESAIYTSYAICNSKYWSLVAAMATAEDHWQHEGVGL